MLIFEGLYLLRTGLVIGVHGGFGIAAIIIYIAGIIPEYLGTDERYGRYPSSD